MYKLLLSSACVVVFGGICIYYLQMELVRASAALTIFVTRQAEQQEILASRAFDVALETSGISTIGWQWYDNSTYGFEVRMPRGWYAIPGANTINGEYGEPAVVLSSTEDGLRRAGTPYLQAHIFKGLETVVLLSKSCKKTIKDFVTLETGDLYREVCKDGFQLLLRDYDPGENNYTDVLGTIAATFKVK